MDSLAAILSMRTAGPCLHQEGGSVGKSGWTEPEMTALVRLGKPGSRYTASACSGRCIYSQYPNVPLVPTAMAAHSFVYTSSMFLSTGQGY